MRGRAVKGILALGGVILFLGAITLFGILGLVSPATLGSRDGAPAAAGPGGPDLPFCDIEVAAAQRGEIPEGEFEEGNIDLDRAVMSENENMALFINAGPFEGDEECQSSVSVSAPDFRIAPPQQSVRVTGQDSQGYVFILAPEKAGRHMFSVSNSGIEWFIADVRVNNWTGLSPFWAQIFAGIGTVFGPILTIPWWLDRRRERKEKSTEENA